MKKKEMIARITYMENIIENQGFTNMTFVNGLTPEQKELAENNVTQKWATFSGTHLLPDLEFIKKELKESQ